MKQRTGAIVDRIVDDKTGKIAEIRLDKKTMWFSCTIDEEHFESKDGNEVKGWARKIVAIPDGAITWQGVIEISLTSNVDRFGRRRYSDGDQECSVDFDLKFDRYYIGKTPVGHWKQMSWSQLDPKSPKYVGDPAAQISVCRPFDLAEQIENPQNAHTGRQHSYGRRSHFADPSKKARPFKLPFADGDSSYSYLPFSEPLWLGLIAIADTIEREGRTIRKLLSTTDGHAAIAAFGTGQPLAIASVSSASSSEPSERERKRGKRA